MKLLILSQGKFATVDDVDFKWASQWKWSAQEGGRAGSGVFYAMRMRRKGEGVRGKVWLHREIAARAYGEIPADHVPHHKQSTLDCTRDNLEIIHEADNNRLARIKSWYSRTNAEDICL